jgi:hypothetical protein
MDGTFEQNNEQYNEGALQGNGKFFTALPDKSVALAESGLIKHNLKKRGIGHKQTTRLAG